MTTKKNINYKRLFITLAIAGIFISTIFSINAEEHPAKVETIDNVPQRAEDISPLLIGESIPKAILKDAEGKDFDLNKAISGKPTLLIFYRGGWCPFCSRQLSGIQEISADLEKTGYQIIAISTDSPAGLQKSASTEKLEYTLLSDASMDLSKKFGLAFKAPKGYWKMLEKTTDGMDTEQLIPVPSVFIIDTKGVIQFEYINPDFKKRISPALIKAVANTIYKEL